MANRDVLPEGHLLLNVSVRVTNNRTCRARWRQDSAGRAHCGHNGKWWYWLPSNRWVVWNGSGWEKYVAPTYGAQPTYSKQPDTTYYRYENNSPNYGGYDSGGYGSSRYGSGYRGYYSPGYGSGIYLGGQGRYGYGNYGYRGYGNNGYGNGRGGYGRGGRW